jgi:hypothetical protein
MTKPALPNLRVNWSWKAIPSKLYRSDKMKNAAKIETNLITIKDLNDRVFPSPDFFRAAKAAITTNIETIIWNNSPTKTTPVAIDWSNGARFCMVNPTDAVTVCGDVVRIEAMFVELANL